MPANSTQGGGMGLAELEESDYTEGEIETQGGRGPAEFIRGRVANQDSLPGFPLPSQEELGGQGEVWP